VEKSKGRLALSEATFLHNQRIESAQRRVTDLTRQLDAARAELSFAQGAKQRFLDAIRGSSRTREARQLRQPAAQHAGAAVATAGRR